MEEKVIDIPCPARPMADVVLPGGEDVRAWPVKPAHHGVSPARSARTVAASTAPAGKKGPYGLPAGTVEEWPIPAGSNRTEKGWPGAGSLEPAPPSLAEPSPWQDWEPPLWRDGAGRALDDSLLDPGARDGADDLKFRENRTNRAALGRSMGALKGHAGVKRSEAAVPRIPLFKEHAGLLAAAVPLPPSGLASVGARLKGAEQLAVADWRVLSRIKPGSASEPPVMTAEEERNRIMQLEYLKRLVDACPEGVSLSEWLDPGQLDLWWSEAGKSYGETVTETE